MSQHRAVIRTSHATAGNAEHYLVQNLIDIALYLHQHREELPYSNIAIMSVQPTLIHQMTCFYMHIYSLWTVGTSTPTVRAFCPAKSVNLHIRLGCRQCQEDIAASAVRDTISVSTCHESKISDQKYGDPISHLRAV